MEGENSFGLTNTLYACTVPCSSGNQTNITNAVIPPGLLASSSTIFGPLAIGPAPGYSLYVATGNAFGSATAPTTLPVALICPTPINLTTEACVTANSAFASVSGGLSPYVASVGIAADASGNAYVATALDGYGTSLTPPSPPDFFGFQASGAAFTCSATPNTCPVDLLPSVAPLTSGPTPPAYSMAFGPAP